MKVWTFKSEREYPASNRVRLLRWRLKLAERKEDPAAVFPLEIYKEELASESTVSRYFPRLCARRRG